MVIVRSQVQEPCSFIRMYDIQGKYRVVMQEEFDIVFEDAAFHERIREITFYGDPAVSLTRFQFILLA